MAQILGGKRFGGDDRIAARAQLHREAARVAAVGRFSPVTHQQQLDLAQAVAARGKRLLDDQAGLWRGQRRVQSPLGRLLGQDRAA